MKLSLYDISILDALASICESVKLSWGIHVSFNVA